MKQLSLAMMIMIGTACTQASPLPEDRTSGNRAGELGSLSFELTATDTKGRQYRLRQAEFNVQGYAPWGDGGVTSTVLSSETDPGAAVISTRLLPGYYNIWLGGNWYIERITANGPERVEKVVLLSEAYQYAYIYHQGTSYVTYRFGVDGELIDFRHGDLNISIGIEQPGDPVDGCGGFGGCSGSGGRAGAGGQVGLDAGFGGQGGSPGGGVAETGN